MPTKDPRRESHFPAIEKRYGEPMKHWFAVMKGLAGKRYPEQVAHLRENYGFSQAHANALVMFSRGSTTTQRHATPTAYFKSIDAQQARTLRAIFKVIRSANPDLEFVIAWNQPMLRAGTSYVIGASATKRYLLLNPFSKKIIASMAPKLSDLRVLKHTITIPNDWAIDEKLLLKMVKARLHEIG
ncbi:MAG: DUF4287 domain-containing protein [Chloroflexi bacterium]|nr:DUF4287 domain-containing protein [Chloroflexota bacterium]